MSLNERKKKNCWTLFAVLRFTLIWYFFTLCSAALRKPSLIHCWPGTKEKGRPSSPMRGFTRCASNLEENARKTLHHPKPRVLISLQAVCVTKGVSRRRKRKQIVWRPHHTGSHAHHKLEKWARLVGKRFPAGFYTQNVNSTFGLKIDPLHLYVT